MIITLKPDTPSEAADALLARISETGLRALHMPGDDQVVLGALGEASAVAELALESHPHVASVKPILAPYKLVSRELHPHDTVIPLGRSAIGGRDFCVIAGPCAVETPDQLRATARAVKNGGAVALRAGAYKPRTSPYSFQGHGPNGLQLLSEAGREIGLPIVTEVMEIADVDLVAAHADIVQVGARNMQNFALLRALGRIGKPILLKRGFAARIEDLLLAAEYILAEGNDQVILCERGIRTFETATRNTLDLAAVPYIKARTHLPVLVDPSHGTGIRDLVLPMSLAAAACGADGLLVEVHEDPAVAWSDGEQSLYPAQFHALMAKLGALLPILGRRLA